MTERHPYAGQGPGDQDAQWHADDGDPTEYQEGISKGRQKFRALECLDPIVEAIFRRIDDPGRHVEAVQAQQHDGVDEVAPQHDEDGSHQEVAF